MEFTRPSPNSTFDVYNSYSIKLLTRLRLDLSNLNEHKFNNGFNDTLNPLCICRGRIESTNLFFSTTLNTVNQGKLSLTTFKALIKCLLSQGKSSLTHTYFFKVTLNATPMLMHSFPNQQSGIEFMLSSCRFNRPLFNGA